MLQVFYVDIAYICNGFQVFVRCFRSVFFCMLQVLHLDVSKVDRASAADLHLVRVDQISDGVSHLHGR
jgi:hypothetical protein